MTLIPPIDYAYAMGNRLSNQGTLEWPVVGRNHEEIHDYYPVPGMNHFEYLLPGTMGYAVIYKGMMVALVLSEYREAGLLKRLESTPAAFLTRSSGRIC